MGTRCPSPRQRRDGRGYDPLVLEDAGAQPLDGGAFEDPRQWADELFEDTGEIPGATATAQGQVNEPSSGVERMVEPHRQVQGRPLQPGELARALEGDTSKQPAAIAEASSKGSSTALKIVLVILVLALIGVGAAIAYLLS